MLYPVTSLLLLFCSVSVNSLVRRGSGVVLVKISSITNTQGRDAAGSCCNGVSDESGVCSGNCYSMLKVKFINIDLSEHTSQHFIDQLKHSMLKVKYKY